jgi:hypothetical protein
MLNLTRRIVLLMAIALLVTASSVFAQMDRGTITGTVTDQTGAVMAGVEVTATNTATGVSTSAKTLGGGAYTIPLLEVGPYQVTAEIHGFKKFVQTGIVLDVGQTIALDIHMQLGAVTETVQVTAQPLLSAETSDRGTVVTARDVEELPIVSQSEQRNPGFYMSLSPGVISRGTANQTASGSGRQLDTVVNGGTSGSTEFFLDGAMIPQTGMMSGDFHYLFFPPEAVGEFNIMTLTVPAEYGGSGLGMTAFTLKSGTNKLHGAAWEMLRNDDLDARGFFASTVPVNKQNEFGATVGGPIDIPHIYNGKDKSFFFGWYHGYRWAGEGGANSKDTLPTAAMKQGNLSNLPVPIYDPTNDATLGPANRPLLAGNIVPPNEIDPLAAKIFSYFKDPPPCSTCQYGYVYNWLTGYGVHTTINDFGGKVDHNISDKNRIMGDFVWWHNYTPGGSKWPGAISEGAISYTQQDITRFSDDYSFTPTLINHAVVGFTRYRNDSYPTAGTGWPGTLGYSGVPQTGPGSTFVEMDIGDLGNTYARGGQSYSTQNNWTLDENLTWSKNRHTVKAGFSYIKLRANGFGSTYQSSYLRFNAGGTALPGPNYNNGCSASGTGGCSGAGVASFLFGMVDYGQAGVNVASTADVDGRYAGYVMDDWKITPKLTLNLGLRYDLMLPSVNAHNQWSWMDPNAINLNLGIKGAQVWAAPGKRAGANADTHELGPRIGLAYAINQKTVLRSAYGLIYSAGGAERDAATSWEQEGYSASNSVAEDSSTGYAGLIPGTVAGNSSYHMFLKNGWPANLFASPPFKNPSAGVGAGLPSFGAYPNDGHLPYLEDWTMGIQRELPGGILLDVAYVGTAGHHLPSRLMNSNATPTYYMTSPEYQYIQPATATTPATPENYIFQPLSGAAQQALPIVAHMPVDPATGLHAPYAGFFNTFGANVPLAQALRPMPQFTADTVEGLSQLRDFGETVGNSIYNALQVQARKHFSQNLSFLVSWTYSKTLTDAESQYNEFSGFTQDFYNARGEKAVSMNDYPNNVSIAYEYLLPFGPGQKFANHGGLVGRVIGGWTISGVQNYTSGAPTMIVYGGAVGNVPSGNPYMGPNSFIARANSVPGVPKKSAAVRNGTWDPNAPDAQGAIYNYAAWTAPPEFTLGTAPREDSAARKFGWLSEDMSLIKRTNITERVNVEFRADFFNIFNRTVFGFDQGGDQYGTVIGGSSIGSGIGGFGHISSQANYPREIQFGLKINY